MYTAKSNIGNRMRFLVEVKVFRRTMECESGQVTQELFSKTRSLHGPKKSREPRENENKVGAHHQIHSFKPVTWCQTKQTEGTGDGNSDEVGMTDEGPLKDNVDWS